ncbi:MAG: HD-GYP domain-containing protein [Nitrospirae bacterium]|nr:MAG: HD-GYP domain-containing protein [Nitrospirota bacterium]
MSVKRIPVSSLKVGMYVCGVDRPWIETPFLVHRFLIKDDSQIAKLKHCGIREVDIDPQRGLDSLNEPPLPFFPQNTASHDVASPSPNPFALIDDPAHCKTVIARLPPSLTGKSFAEEFSSMQTLRERMLEEVSDLLHSIRTSGLVSGNHVKNIVRTIMSETLGHEEACLAVIRTRHFSPDLYDHSLTVGTLAVLLGRLMEYDDSQLRLVAMAALLHDIGLLKLPKHLLRGPERRSSDDRILFQSHPTLSVELLQASSGIPEEVLQLVADHHAASATRFSEDTVMLGHMSRLIRVVDEYDELLSGQERECPLSVKDALRELYLQSQRNQLDQTIVTQLINQVGIYPIYSLVELNTGERGIVTAHSPDNLLTPILLLIQDANRHPLSEPVPFRLSSDGNSSQREIVSVLDPERESIRVDRLLADWVSL